MVDLLSAGQDAGVFMHVDCSLQMGLLLDCRKGACHSRLALLTYVYLPISAAPPQCFLYSIQACMQEEIEELFVSVRDLILSRPDGDVAEVKWLLDHLPSAQQQGGRRQQQHQDSIGQLIQVRTAPWGAVLHGLSGSHSMLASGFQVAVPMSMITCTHSCSAIAPHLVDLQHGHAYSSDLQLLPCNRCLQTQLLTSMGLRAVPLMPA